MLLLRNVGLTTGESSNAAYFHPYASTEFCIEELVLKAKGFKQAEGGTGIAGR